MGGCVVSGVRKTIGVAELRRFRPYPTYKDSGVEWLRQIPAHWEVKKLAWLTKCLDGRRRPLNAEERGRMQGDYPYWGANSIVDYVDRWLFDEELVLLGEDGAPFFDRDKTVAFHVSGKIWVNNHTHVLRPGRNTNAAFLAYTLNAVDFGAFIGGATRDKLTQGDMNGIPIQCPSIEEQRAIAGFLDRETAKINALVAKKERLIGLLQEKRTAIITRAVTKGLDPNVPMKDSGVEWLGKIPAQWEVWRLKHASGGLTVGVVVNPSQYVSPSGVPFLRGVDVTEGRILMDRIQFMTETANQMHSKSVLREGDLVSIRVGYPGVTAVIPAELDGSNCASLLITRRSPRFRSELICYLMNSAIGKAQFKMLQDGAAQEQINVSDAVDFLVPLPPLKEQVDIIKALDREAARIDVLVGKVHNAINQLKELRTTLISAAVTGKIDVREEAA
jgi:type I restriction enzyme S subunit